MEIMLAHLRSKKIVLVYKATNQPSKMLLDLANHFEYPIVKYSSADPIYTIVDKIIIALSS